MMTIIMQSLQYIRLESQKVPSRVENTLKRKNMGHISNFNLEMSVSRVKNIRICLQINISPFSTHYLYPNNIVEE